MDERDWLAERFEDNRTHLRAVAYRTLGSVHEADDAVQESWLRLSRADTSGVENLGGWLTTVVARVCLDMLRSRTARREEPLADQPVSAAATCQGHTRPRAGRAAGRLGRSRAAGRARHPRSGGAGRFRDARPLRRPVRRDRPDRRTLSDRGPAAGQPSPPPGARGPDPGDGPHASAQGRRCVPGSLARGRF